MPSNRDWRTAIGDYLPRTSSATDANTRPTRFGVSRRTLWVSIERSRAGCSLPRAVLNRAGESQDAVDAAWQALLARPLPDREKTPTPDYLS
jgi:hypothetical protein